nr:lysosomal alpha-glucosidase [Seculamonas ecuadoriensis]
MSLLARHARLLVALAVCLLCVACSATLTANAPRTASSSSSSSSSSSPSMAKSHMAKSHASIVNPNDMNLNPAPRSVNDMATPPVYRVTLVANHERGMYAQLTLSQGAGPYGRDVRVLDLNVDWGTEDRLRVHITDSDGQRWQVPGVIVDTDPPRPSNIKYRFDYTAEPFAFWITRLLDNEVVFDTRGHALVFEDQYLEITSSLPNNPNIYGLGERVHNFRLDPNNRVWTIFNKDHGTQPDINLYGSHAFYTEYRAPHAHGVFLLNSNAMDVVLTMSSITYKVIGGVFDFYFFMGPDPKSVVAQYTELVGRPYMPPYWALGFHQCRWGYHTLADVEEVVAEYAKNELPLDTIWNDIDYMDGYRDFTFSPDRFPLAKVQSFVHDLHQKNMQYVVILDPGIKAEPGYAAYDRGLQQNAFIKDAATMKPILNMVWPGITAFPDFHSEKGRNYWKSEITTLLKQVPIDGLWIDMNEIVGFCDAQCSSAAESAAPTESTDAAFNANNPPYKPGNQQLYSRTLNMTAISEMGIEYNVHSLYGYHETLATKEALEVVRGKRALVIGRSTFAGQGKHGYHWLGDNESTFQSMFDSISGILNMNMFGIPLVGADICGFNGNTTEELCTRWMQLGSFYPFSRNHNAIASSSQEPYSFSPTMTKNSRAALLMRYSLLPYYYTLFYRAHTSGCMVIRPLFFEFPDDTVGNLAYIDRQFMVGPALMVAPVLDQGATTVSAYFPNDVWYCYYEGKVVASKAGWVTVDAPLEKIPVFVRAGHIVPMQVPALTTAQSRKNPLQLLVALDAQGAASGEIYLDDGDSLDSIVASKYTHVVFTAASASTALTISAQNEMNRYPIGAALPLEHLEVLGVPKNVCSITLGGAKITSFTYDASKQTLDITLPSSNAVASGWKVVITYC